MTRTHPHDLMQARTVRTTDFDAPPAQRDPAPIETIAPVGTGRQALGPSANAPH
jgi:hypothetical protein